MRLAFVIHNLIFRKTIDKQKEYYFERNILCKIFGLEIVEIEVKS